MTACKVHEWVPWTGFAAGPPVNGDAGTPYETQRCTICGAIRPVPEGPLTLTHIAGFNLSIRGRYTRQRCAWCGLVIVEYDLAQFSGLVGPDGQALGGPAVYPVGGFVRESADRYDLIESKALPPDFCGWLDDETLDTGS